MMSQDFEYDVAISFLAADEATARALADKLEAAGLRVFFFPRNQEELAGTNGLESMRSPFFAARVVVVLFRPPWEATPWTRVESTAIQERCLEQGWDSLLFVELDKKVTRPTWLPSTHIRFSLPDYGIEQLVGAVKLRVQDRGGVIKPLNALDEARRVKRQSEHLLARKSMMRDRKWIEDTVQGRCCACE